MAVWSQIEEFGFIVGSSGLEFLVFRRPLVFKYRYDISSAPQIGPTTTYVLWGHIAQTMTKSSAEGPVGGAARKLFFLIRMDNPDVSYTRIFTTLSELRLF